MKKYIAIGLIVALLGVFVAPPKASAGAADGALIGAAVGLVAVLVISIAKSAGDPTVKDKVSQNVEAPARDMVDIAYNPVREELNSGGFKEREMLLFSYKLAF